MERVRRLRSADRVRDDRTQVVLDRQDVDEVEARSELRVGDDP
jgi:hypothetical protein